MRRNKALYVMVLVCALAGVGAWELLKGQNGLQYRTAAVERGEVDYAISATGNPNAVVTVQVGSQVSGNIMALYADFNSKVTKGQLIARIDPAPFQAKVRPGAGQSGRRAGERDQRAGQHAKGPGVGAGGERHAGERQGRRDQGAGGGSGCARRKPAGG